jgi:hypothetical protein
MARPTLHKAMSGRSSENAIAVDIELDEWEQLLQHLC